jgi:hypothetical protein
VVSRLLSPQHRFGARQLNTRRRINRHILRDLADAAAFDAEILARAFNKKADRHQQHEEEY